MMKHFHDFVINNHAWNLENYYLEKMISPFQKCWESLDSEKGLNLPWRLIWIDSKSLFYEI